MNFAWKHVFTMKSEKLLDRRKLRSMKHSIRITAMMLQRGDCIIRVKIFALSFVVELGLNIISANRTRPNTTV